MSLAYPDEQNFVGVAVASKRARSVSPTQLIQIITFIQLTQMKHTRNLLILFQIARELQVACPPYLVTRLWVSLQREDSNNQSQQSPETSLQWLAFMPPFQLFHSWIFLKGLPSCHPSVSLLMAANWIPLSQYLQTLLMKVRSDTEDSRLAILQHCTHPVTLISCLISKLF